MNVPHFNRGSSWLDARVVLVVLVTTGCASLQAGSALELLQEAIDGYNHAYRWKNYDRAAQFLPSDRRGPFLAAYEEDSTSLQIDDYQVVNTHVDNDDHAQVTIQVSYMLLPSVTIQKAKLIQEWHRTSGVWVLESELNSIRKLDLGASPKRNPETGNPQDPCAHNKPGQICADSPAEVEVFGPGSTLPKDSEDDSEDDGSDDP